MSDLPMSGAAPRLMPLLHSTSFPESNSLEISTESWAAGDKATREIIRKIQPTSVSEHRRRKVVHYIQKLIRGRLGAEVFPYGSVPLKTYLPDGDIDLTLFGGANNEDNLVDDIRLILDEEGKNTSSEFVVKDVQTIRAEVKLVKCIVQDIVVDVSFNQIGGLCTLCFLEQVDRLIGKDHLFKRSIILIKAWCYYESRILGAHHGLISTYALETLVLYIFHFFHSTLDGPLAVLYKFLDYFSKFDWETYCVSLHGAVRLSSMPDVVAEMPEDSDRDLLLTNEFLSSCVSTFSVPFTSGDKTLRTFQCKNLNIIDPLKEINNLGRSVSKGNFYRIRSAFSYGARKLAQILLQPKPFIAIELKKFFPNTMARHGGEQRSDVQDLELSRFCKRPVGGCIPETVLPKMDHSYEFDGISSTGGFRSPSGTISQDIAQEMESTSSNMRNREQLCSSVLKVQTVMPDGDWPSKPYSLDSSFLGDSNNIKGPSLGSLKISPESSRHQNPALKGAVNTVVKSLCAPHLHFSKSKTHDDNVKDVNHDSNKCDKFGQNPSFMTSSGAGGGIAFVTGSVNEKQLIEREALALRTPDAVLSDSKSSSTLGYPNHGDMEPNSACGVETPKSLRLSDLTGNYDGYLRWLQFGRWCYEYGLSVHSLHIPPLSTTPMYPNGSLWDGIIPVSHFKQTGFSHPHLNGFHPNPALYSMRPVLLPGVAFGWEEPPKPKGTGTYIPNVNQPQHVYRSSTVKGRGQVPSRSPRSNGRHTTFEPNMVDRRSHESPQPQFPVENNCFEKYMPISPDGSGGFPNMANRPGIQPEAVVEHEVVGHGSGSRQQRSVGVSSSTVAMPGVQPPLSREQDRISLRSSYHLRDEDDFPPLSGVERLSVI